MKEQCFREEKQLRKKRRKNKAVFALMVIALLFMGAFFLWLDLPEQVRSYFDLSAIGEEYDTEVFPEEPFEDAAKEAQEVNDPFAETEKKETPEKDLDEPKEMDEQENLEDQPLKPSENEMAGSYNDFKVIADGDYYLALVTKETTLKSNYKPTGLEALPSYMNPSYPMWLRWEALEHLEKLWAAAKEDGILFSIRSAYRSYETQEQIFKDFVSQYGEEEANRFSARPGQSEHQLGTTVDFGGTEVDFKTQFGQTPLGRWLAQNAHHYGFAKSYPQGKEHITGYIYEPWHFRYIGVSQARQWKQSGLTLNQYLEQQPQEFE